VISTAQGQRQIVGSDGTHYYTYSFSYPPGYTDIIPAVGDWLDLLSLNNANYASCLYVALNNGTPFPVSYLPVRSPFNIIRVYNGCTSTVSGTFIIGRELFQPAKISVALPATMNVNIQYPLDSNNNVNVDVQSKAGYAPYMNATILNAQAITANGSSSNIDVGGYPYVFVFVYVSAVSGTSPSLNVYLNAYDEVSGQSVSIASVTNITSTGTYYISASGLAVRYVNVSWTVGGTSPSFTVTITLKAKW
jgi:hypothetical protein